MSPPAGGAAGAVNALLSLLYIFIPLARLNQAKSTTCEIGPIFALVVFGSNRRMRGMSDKLKTLALFAVIAGLWFLIPQVGLAQADGTTDVPEPASLTLLASGVAATLFAVWRRRK
jgi:hypothetical protein